MRNLDYKSIQRKAFSLPEVLITLLIISVIASLTLPNVIGYFQEQTLLNQFKKVDSELSQAYLSAAQDYGNSDSGSWNTKEDIANNLKPYLNISESCGTHAGCFPNVIYKGLRGGSSGTTFYPENSYWVKYRLSDGTSIVITDVKDLFVDINGDKGPNQFGYDLFILSLNTKNNAPYIGYGVDGGSTSINSCSKTLDSSGWYDGASCSYWVLRNWNMDYLHRNISATEWNN